MEINTIKLQPIRIDDLVRKGRDHDGGYVIPKSVFSDCDGLLSFGINKDWSFEQNYLAENPKAIIHCYDHTLNLKSLIVFTIKSFFLTIIHCLLLDKKRCKNAFYGLGVLPSYFKFFKKDIVHFKHRIWDSNIDDSKTIEDALTQISNANAKNIFIKMDIEKAEYQVFNSIIKTDKMVAGMVVEFHQIDVYSKEFNSIIDKALEKYHIVHIHGNNYGKLIDYIDFPSSVEITFMLKDFVKGPIELSDASYPTIGLDMPNLFTKLDIKLTF